MLELFFSKLRSGAPLSSEDETLFGRIAPPVRRVRAGESILHEGDQPSFITLIVEGWACRSKQLENGRRQIMCVFVPGDLCEPFGILPRFLDHSLSALTPVTFMQFLPEALRNAAEASPGIHEALWWDMLVAAATQREHAVSLGQRTAVQRLAHLLCELHLRLRIIGLADETGFGLPVTQTDLGDILGLTSVHISRSLRDLREAGLCTLKSRRLTVHSVARLRAEAMFDPVYLHLDHRASD